MNLVCRRYLIVYHLTRTSRNQIFIHECTQMNTNIVVDNMMNTITVTDRRLKPVKVSCNLSPLKYRMNPAYQPTGSQRYIYYNCNIWVQYSAKQTRTEFTSWTQSILLIRHCVQLALKTTPNGNIIFFIDLD